MYLYGPSVPGIRDTEGPRVWTGGPGRVVQRPGRVVGRRDGLGRRQDPPKGQNGWPDVGRVTQVLCEC